MLCLFEVVSYSGWQKHGALDWTYDTAVGVVALAGLIGAITVLAATSPPPGRGLTRCVAQIGGSGWRCTRDAR